MNNNNIVLVVIGIRKIQPKPTAITGANTQFGYLHHQLTYPIKVQPQL
jgi:hypothetical protein